ncbi:protein of unknown function [Microbacterium sp. Nx66]|nr:protein of unknown function [Microbacterium sp. Nx66]
MRCARHRSRLCSIVEHCVRI